MATQPSLPNWIKSTGVTGVSSKAVTFRQSVLAGSLILVAGHIWRASDPHTIGVTDDQGNSYTVKEGSSGAWSGGFSRGFLAYAVQAATSIPVVTVTPSGSSSFITFGVVEIPDVNASPIDVDGGESTGTSTAPADALTTATNNAIVVGIVAIQASGSNGFTPNSGYSIIFQDAASDNASFCFLWRRAVTAGAFTVGLTIGGSKLWSVYTLGIKP